MVIHCSVRVRACIRAAYRQSWCFPHTYPRWLVKAAGLQGHHWDFDVDTTLHTRLVKYVRSQRPRLAVRVSDFRLVTDTESKSFRQTARNASRRAVVEAYAARQGILNPTCGYETADEEDQGDVHDSGDDDEDEPLQEAVVEQPSVSVIPQPASAPAAAELPPRSPAEAVAPPATPPAAPLPAVPLLAAPLSGRGAAHDAGCAMSFAASVEPPAGRRGRGRGRGTGRVLIPAQPAPLASEAAPLPAAPLAPASTDTREPPPPHFEETKALAETTAATKATGGAVAATYLY